MNALIVGYGNPLRGDDRVGWHLAALIGRACGPARVLTVHALLPELAPEVAAADVVLFLDARRGSARGRVSRTVIEPSPSDGVPAHGLTPAALLHLAGTLYGRCASAYLVTIETNAFRIGAGLSREAQNACAEAVRQGLEIILAPGA
jgi:hydrogenase maturation protease